MRRHLLFTDQGILDSHVGIDHLPKTLPSNEIEHKRAFITGATGFIGGYLLKALLQSGAFESYICLVRSKDEKAGLERIIANLHTKGTPGALLHQNRISVVVGDILQPRFGLEERHFEALATAADHVFHFAATMNWVTPFNQDTIANINALKEMTRFCATAKLKKLHYASSMGMWTLLHHKEGPILETEIHQQGHELPGGYFQSKWVNEKILQLASAAGLPINVYRIGDVKGNSEDGQGDPQNFGNLVMQYFIQQRVVIDSGTPEFNFIPVDYLTRSISHIALGQAGGTFQFSNPELISFHDIYQAAKACGLTCRLVSHSEWTHLLKANPDPLGKMLTPIFKKFTPGHNCAPTSFYDIGVDMFKKRHDTTNTQQALKGTEITCPGMLSHGILQRYLIHLGETTFS